MLGCASSTSSCAWFQERILFKRHTKKSSPVKFQEKKKKKKTVMDGMPLYPQNSYAGVLTPSVMIFGGEAYGR